MPERDDGTIADLVASFYGQMQYHFGWRHADLSAAEAHPGKMLRPTLLLLGCELAAGRAGRAAAARDEMVQRALPAAVAVEIVHNFSLVHDDIEDGDEQRRHRATLWRVWGQAEAINTGDGMFTLARMTLLTLADAGTDGGVAPALVLRLARILDQTCLRLCEGQHLDMRFEGRHDVSEAMYLAMIERKTAALMAAALEMGALLGGADDALARQLAAFGRALGLGFQIRDDLLGIWAADTALGKSEAGDLRRKKMSLPVITALAHAAPDDRAALLGALTGDGPASDEQVATAFGVLARTGARERVRAALRRQCDAARAALAAATDDAPDAREPAAHLAALVDFVAHDALP
jgi:geranylgeranyl diphosphate synthase type I